jgi:hypothetical protein
MNETQQLDRFAAVLCVGGWLVSPLLFVAAWMDGVRTCRSVLFCGYRGHSVCLSRWSLDTSDNNMLCCCRSLLWSCGRCVFCVRILWFPLLCLSLSLAHSQLDAIQQSLIASRVLSDVSLETKDTLSADFASYARCRNGVVDGDSPRRIIKNLLGGGGRVAVAV